jgi:hypothetical protein
MHSRHLLKAPVRSSNMDQSMLLEIAAKELGIREKTGNNDGKQVEVYLRSVGLNKGNPWCAAFVCWVYRQRGYAQPNSGWSPALFPTSHLVKLGSPGDVVGIYFVSLKRIAHVGIIEKIDADWVYTIEGNTNLSGSREGDGVYRKVRPLKSIHRYAHWLRRGDKK